MLRAPESAAANAYRLALRNIQTAGGPRERSCYLVVAVDASANGALVAANLGAAAALNETPTILVDGDLHQPRLHTLFNIGNESGLSTLGGPDESKTCLQRAGVGELLVLPAGPHSEGAPGLAAPALAGALRQITATADLVLVSCAPLLTAPDAALLATWVTGTVLVLRANRTRQDDLVRARNQLERFGSRLIGVILDGGSR
jgi:Mrp family chromosome partitioning ATPase